MTTGPPGGVSMCAMPPRAGGFDIEIELVAQLTRGVSQQAGLARAEFGGLRVPETLLNGDHAGIRRWRREQQLRKTLANRPDLLENAALSKEDRKLLEAVIHRFDGGPVGLDNVAAAIGEEPGTIEDVIEPYLIQQGYLQRTPRGRIATLAAYRHLGVAPPAAAGELPGI